MQVMKKGERAIFSEEGFFFVGGRAIFSEEAFLFCRGLIHQAHLWK